MELTKAEEQVMQVLWTREKAFVKELLLDFDEPKPAYNTVSTIIRILEKKGFVGHEAIGKSHLYYPIVSRGEYRKNTLGRIMKDFFKNSGAGLVAHLVKEEKLDLNELSDLVSKLKNQKK